MKMKLALLLTAVMFMVAFLPMFARGAEAPSDIAYITETTTDPIDITADFVCPQFLFFVRVRINKPADPIYNTDVAGITQLLIGSLNITSLAGIEHFTALTSINISQNQITELDLSANTALTSISINQNHIAELDLSANTALRGLTLTWNQLEKLNVSANTALEVLNVSYDQQLTELDVSNNTVLTGLYVRDNLLTELDLSNNTVLTNLYVDYNLLTELDLSNNTALRDIVLDYNLLTELDLSNNTALRFLSAGNNRLTELDVSANTMLWSLNANDNLLTELNVSNNIGLTNLSVSNNLLTELDVSANTMLNSLHAAHNLLTELCVSNNIALAGLFVSYNQLTELDVSGNIALGWLDARRNNMISPDDVIGWQYRFNQVEPEGWDTPFRFHFHPQHATVREITVSPEIANISPGSTQQFTANVIFSGNADTTVIWSAIGNYAVGTTINEDGFLTVAEDETAASLTVRATSIFDTSVCGTATVSVGFGEVPQTGLPNLTAQAAAMLAFSAVSAGLWVYVLRSKFKG